MRGILRRRTRRLNRELAASIDGHLVSDVTAGAPGSFTGGRPYNLTDLRAQGALGETTAWTTGQSVALQDGSSAYWDGNSWEAGTAP
jgi:hypothetical protein